ncbi:hypothetical protein Cylst_6390 (plasmid) [Cylindrospermum stagnale PCC 7417]|uniref:Uncharacterized protein n=1 Tax=Cylindrospermum stagnale PCC 7417 TaxID=56107 RepID=K9X826_9NOST|nr:hypothetical protein Cylst_6390 [Cylindrospermum stagnale PCC 7417]
MDDGRDAIFKQWLAKDLAKLDATAASDKVQNHVPVASTDGNYKNEPLSDTRQAEPPQKLSRGGCFGCRESSSVCS